MTIEKLELETRLPMHKLRNRHLRRCYRRHFERGLPSRLHLVVTMFVLGTFARVVVPRRAAHSECRPPSSRAQTCAAFLGQCVSHDAPKPERLRRFPRRSIQHAPEVEKAMIEEQLTDSEKLKQQICDEILRKLKLQVDRVMRSSSSESEAN